MNPVRARRVPLLVSLVVTSCYVQETPCHPYTRKGDAIQIVVVGKEETPSSAFLNDLPPCSIDDVHVGDTLRLEVGDPIETSSACYDFACPVDFPAPSKPLGESLPRLGLNYLCLGADRKLDISDGCEAARFVALYAPVPVQDVYAPARPDGSTPVHMLRALTLATRESGELSCTNRPTWIGAGDVEQRDFFCADVWRVELTKID